MAADPVALVSAGVGGLVFDRRRQLWWIVKEIAS
jgi:hypothetical protein